MAAVVDLEAWDETHQRRSELRSERANVAFLLVLITLVGFSLYVLNDGAKVRGLPYANALTAAAYIMPILNAQHLMPAPPPNLACHSPTCIERLHVTQPNAKPSPAAQNYHTWLWPALLVLGSCTCCCCFSIFFGIVIEKVQRTVDDSTSTASFTSSV